MTLAVKSMTNSTAGAPFQTFLAQTPRQMAIYTISLTPKSCFFRRETTWITQANSYFVACTAYNTGYATENTTFRNFCSSATGAFDT